MGTKAADPGQIKGTSLAMTVDLVRERAGEEGVRTLREKLPARVRGVLPEDLRPLPTELLSFAVWGEVLLAAEELFGRPTSLVRESSRRGYAKLLKSTYRNWVKEGDPLESVRRLSGLWQQVTSGIGTLAVEEGAAGPVVVVHLSVDPRYRGLAEERLVGCIEALVEAAGGIGRVTLLRRGGRSELHVELG